jgi:hypothetical protein
MIKGTYIENSFSDKNHLPFLYSDHYLSLPQDSIRNFTAPQGSVLQIAKPKNMALDTTVDRLFTTTEARTKSISKPKIFNHTEINSVDSTEFSGSTSRIYYDIIPSFQKLPAYTGKGLNENFLANISEKTIDIHYKLLTVDKDTALGNTTPVNTSASITTIIPKQEIPSGFEGKERILHGNGWYILMLLIAVSIFAWGKSLYQKYLFQILASAYNYHTSIQLFRDKNVLFRNLSLILQVLFPLNVGLLLYFLIDFYHWQPPTGSAILNIFLLSFGVFLFFRLKILIYKALGHIFKVQEDFLEVQHHLNIFTKTLGVILLPFVVSMPFLNDSLKVGALFLLFGFLSVIMLLFFFRGIQIVNRKQVSFFFLILYLCAVEILPVALIVKASYTII